MEELNRKYKQNQLSDNDLLQLREKLNLLSDDELDYILCEEWMNGDIDTSNVTSEELTRMKQNVDKKIFTGMRVFLLNNTLRYTAIILLPLLLFSTFYLYKQLSYVKSEDMIVTTGVGERANITLPDGTKVSISSESTLRYAPHLFNRSERKVEFEGEAYFDVIKNTSSPFSIITSDVEIRVLGTKFNLQARTGSPELNVFLEEGHVLLTSTSNMRQELFPNQKAVYNKCSEMFRVEKSNAVEELHWLRRELVFRKTPLNMVLKEIEKQYRVKIVFDEKDSFYRDLFTGILPSDDLMRTVRIFTEIYQLNCELAEDKVKLSRK